jgi:hypothetical protein
MALPQNHLAIKVSFDRKDSIASYEISHKRDGQFVEVYKHRNSVSYFRGYENKNDNLTFTLFTLALSKGLVWTRGDESKKIDESTFKWNTFLCSTFRSLATLPPLEELKEQYSSFEMSSDKVKTLLQKADDIMNQYHIVIDITQQTELVANLLKHIAQKEYISVDEREVEEDEDYQENLAFFNKVEDLLYLLIQRA